MVKQSHHCMSIINNKSTKKTDTILNYKYKKIQYTVKLYKSRTTSCKGFIHFITHEYLRSKKVTIINLKIYYN